MDKASLIGRTKTPATRETLKNDIKCLGVGAGDIVLVHSSLGAMGWISGGPVAVVQALLDAVGVDGTIVMPATFGRGSQTANWVAPAVPVEWVELIRASMPAYQPAITPTRRMGAVVEVFRTWPAVRRSPHPATSMAALGPHADEITAHHELSDPLGLTSPLGVLYRLNAKILLIGVEFNRCTALHLAEDIRWPDRRNIREGAPISVDGERRWVEFSVPEIMDDDAFLPVGAAALAAGVAALGTVAQAQAIVASMPRLVDFAVDHWGEAVHPAGP